jgi:iron-sulfur cluster repair protein YtfE (RIC family)
MQANIDASLELTQALSHDHDRLDKLLDEAERALDLGEMTRALAFFTSFERGFSRHLWLEETIIFPLYEQRVRRPTATCELREEHARLLRLARATERALARGARPEAAGFFRNLRWILDQHHQREEELLFPAAERTMTVLERKSLVHHIGA